MEKYLVKSAEEAISSGGKKYKRVVLEAADNTIYKISVWPEFSKYTEISAGNFVEGKIIENKGFKNLVDEIQYRPPSKASGARQGLEQKMSYWKDKDFRTEFSIIVGQASNLAAPNKGNEKKWFDFWFEFILAARLDRQNIGKFMKYWLEKTSFEQEMAKKYDKEVTF